MEKENKYSVPLQILQCEGARHISVVENDKATIRIQENHDWVVRQYLCGPHLRPNLLQ